MSSTFFSSPGSNARSTIARCSRSRTSCRRSWGRSPWSPTSAASSIRSRFRRDAAPEGVLKDLFLGTCFVAGDPPADRQWALDRAGVLRRIRRQPGQGRRYPDRAAGHGSDPARRAVRRHDHRRLQRAHRHVGSDRSALGRRQSWSRDRDRQRLGEWTERSGARFGAGGDPGADPLHRIGDPDLQRRRGRQGHRPRAPAWLPRRDDEPRRNPEPRHAEGDQAGDPVRT